MQQVSLPENVHSRAAYNVAWQRVRARHWGMEIWGSWEIVARSSTQQNNYFGALHIILVFGNVSVICLARM